MNDPLNPSGFYLDQSVDEKTTFVGMDVSGKSIYCYVIGSGSRPGSTRIENTRTGISGFFLQLKKLNPTIIAAYEAGDGGYTIARLLNELSIDCRIIKPLRPGLSGPIKTDHRDAVTIAQDLKAGILDFIWIPGNEFEMIREVARERWTLVRQREDYQRRIGCHIRSHSKDPVSAGLSVSASSNGHLQSLQDHRKFLDGRIEESSKKLIEMGQPFTDRLLLLRAFRGIDQITSIVLLAEVGDFQRFPTAEKFVSYLGLAPINRNSGKRHTVQGPIKATLAKQYILQAVRHYRQRVSSSRSRVEERRKDISEEKAQMTREFEEKLFCLGERYSSSNKPGQTIDRAIANKLAQYIWLTMTHN